jgi:hypothetical protein
VIASAVQRGRALLCNEGVGMVTALVDAGVMRAMAAYKHTVADLV